MTISLDSSASTAEMHSGSDQPNPNRNNARELSSSRNCNVILTYPDEKDWS